jgi:hypothetical protein
MVKMFSVETPSFLPKEQSDRGNLARQGKTSQVRLHPSRQARFVETLKRSAVTGGPGGRTLEDIFQIVVVVAV